MPGFSYLFTISDSYNNRFAASLVSATFRTESNPIRSIIPFTRGVSPKSTKLPYTLLQRRLPSKSALNPEVSQKLQFVRSTRMFLSPFPMIPASSAFKSGAIIASNFSLQTVIQVYEPYFRTLKFMARRKKIYFFSFSSIWVRKAASSLMSPKVVFSMLSFTVLTLLGAFCLVAAFFLAVSSVFFTSS